MPRERQPLSFFDNLTEPSNECSKMGLGVSVIWLPVRPTQSPPAPNRLRFFKPPCDSHAGSANPGAVPGSAGDWLRSSRAGALLGARRRRDHEQRHGLDRRRRDGDGARAVDSPVRVETPAGPIDLRFDGDIFLTGPAEIVAEGVFLRAWRHSARANQPAPRYNNRS